MKRRLCTGATILPFSIRKVPSRVMPVITTVIGCTGRVYQKRLTQMPRCVEASISSFVASPVARNMLPGMGPQVSPAGMAWPVEVVPACAAV